MTHDHVNDCPVCRRDVADAIAAARAELLPRIPKPRLCVHGVREDLHTRDGESICPLCRHLIRHLAAIPAPELDYAALAAGEDTP